MSIFDASTITWHNAPTLETAVTDDASHSPTLPPWATRVFEQAAAIPGAGHQIALWLPTFSAAYGAGRQAIALARAIQGSLDEDREFVWPDELAAELMTTLAALGDALPTLDEAIPATTGLVDLGEQLMDPELAQALALDGLLWAEKIAQAGLTALIDAAFFAAQSGNAQHRTRELQKLFGRLESLFDQALQVILTANQDDGGHR